MTSLVLPRCRFLHFPKTGGWWIYRALEAAGVGFYAKDTNVQGGHHGFADTPTWRPCFGFIRHPESWYRSMFYYLQRIEWTFHPDARRPDVNSFVRAVLSGHVTIPCMSDWVSLFFGTESLVYRMENGLANGLMSALDVFGEQYSAARLREFDKQRVLVNQTPPEMKVAPLEQSTIELIRSAEKSIYERFEYD